MYWGICILYFGGALQHASVLMVISLGLSLFISAKFEGLFTTMIYAKHARASEEIIVLLT